VVVPVESLLRSLDEYAKSHQLIVVDLGRTKRIDFVACSQITNALSKLQQAGHAIELRSLEMLRPHIEPAPCAG